MDESEDSIVQRDTDALTFCKVDSGDHGCVVEGRGRMNERDGGKGEIRSVPLLRLLSTSPMVAKSATMPLDSFADLNSFHQPTHPLFPSQRLPWPTSLLPYPARVLQGTQAQMLFSATSSSMPNVNIYWHPSPENEKKKNGATGGTGLPEDLIPLPLSALSPEWHSSIYTPSPLRNTFHQMPCRCPHNFLLPLT